MAYRYEVLDETNINLWLEEVSVEQNTEPYLKIMDLYNFIPLWIIRSHPVLDIAGVYPVNKSLRPGKPYRTRYLKGPHPEAVSRVP